jgi:hypothetical protein
MTQGTSSVKGWLSPTLIALTEWFDAGGCMCECVEEEAFSMEHTGSKGSRKRPSQI